MKWRKTALNALVLSVLCTGSAFAQAEGQPQAGKPQPPPEAFAACKDKKEGDKAEFTGRQGNKITGTCKREPQGKRLVLRPDHQPKGEQHNAPQQHGGQQDGPPPPPPDHQPQGEQHNAPQQHGGQQDGPPQPPPEAFAACKDKQEGDKAALTGPQGQTISGTCTQRDGQLFLRPDHPPKRTGQDANSSGQHDGPKQNSGKGR